MKYLKLVMIIFSVTCVFTTPILCFAAQDEDGGGSAYPAVTDLMGIYPVTENSCIAVWVPIASNMALSGIKWFNNDDLSVFPEILVESGSVSYPVSMSDCQVVAQNVSGLESQWSEVTFNEPVSCASAGFYVLFRFSEGSEYTGLGHGGGSAVGFCTEGGLPGWVSSEGDDWFRVGSGFGFAVTPTFVEAEEWMLHLKGVRSPVDSDTTEEIVFVNGLESPAPNPFNPSTEIKFSLAAPASVCIGVYDLHGRLVNELVNEEMASGRHSVTWLGRGRDGRRVASGVYFARMVTGNASFAHKLVLVK